MSVGKTSAMSCNRSFKTAITATFACCLYIGIRQWIIVIQRQIERLAQSHVVYMLLAASVPGNIWQDVVSLCRANKECDFIEWVTQIYCASTNKGIAQDNCR